MSLTPGGLRWLANELDSVANAVDAAVEHIRESSSIDLDAELARLGAPDGVDGYREALVETLKNASRCLVSMADGALYATRRGTCEGMLEDFRAREARAQFRVVEENES